VNVLPIESQEPHVVELKDGRLMMILRTYEQCLGKSYSTDGGETWSKAELIRELKSSPNASPTNVKRIPSTGDLLLLRTTGGEGGRRTPFVAVISKDDGATWQNEKVIAGDPNDDYGYPSLTFVDDFALVFYHKRDGLYVARVGVDWLYQQPTQVTAAESKP
jgi:predicted neuraminidase